MKSLRILIGCECSGVVRRAFRGCGHDAWSCDLLPALDGDPHHFQGDVREVLDGDWDVGIFHPECTYLCNSSVWALTRTPPHPSPGVRYGAARVEAMHEAALFFRALYDAPIPRVAVENPIMHGRARTLIGVSPTQIVQPYQLMIIYLTKANR